MRHRTSCMWLVCLVLAAGCGDKKAEEESQTSAASSDKPRVKVAEAKVSTYHERVDDALSTAGAITGLGKPEAPGDTWWKPAATACPDGATLHGGLPPGENEVWCALPDGRLHGRATKWNKLGFKLAYGEYRNGKKHGLFISYYRNGVKRMESHYENGLENGPVTTRHPNGHKALEGTYRNGKGFGPWTKWDPDGNQIGEGSY